MHQAKAQSETRFFYSYGTRSRLRFAARSHPSARRVIKEPPSGQASQQGSLRPLPDNRPAVPEPSKVDVAAFVKENIVRYDGDGSFLAGATEKTLKLWDKVQALQAEEIKKGGEAWTALPSLAKQEPRGHLGDT